MTTLPQAEWEECFVEPCRNAALERDFRRGFGFVPPSVPYFGACPWVARSLIGFNLNRAKLVHLNLDLVEKIGVVVGQDNSCRFCYAVHRAVLRMVGMREDRIRSLEQELLPFDQDGGERRILEFARRLSRSNPPISMRDLAPLRALGLPDGTIREIALVTFVNVIWNRFATFPALPSQRVEQLPDRWLVRIARPLIGRVVRARWRRGQAIPLPPEKNRGPFSALVASLGGLPLAYSLRELIDEAWSSPILPTRTKALVIAVVARGLGCARSEREAAKLVAAEGLGSEELEPILEHLSSPRLDAVEAVAVPFARETIWYRAAAIQRRARAVHERLTPAQFLELLGMTGLANGLCRLGFLLEMD